MVNQNYSLVEAFATILDNAFLRFCSDIDNIMDAYGQQENDEVNCYLTEDIDNSESEAFKTMEGHSGDVGNNNLMSNKLPAIPDNIIKGNIRSLNMKQREIFNFIHKWSRDYIRSFRCKVIKKCLMPQRGDFEFISLLNKIREEKIDDNVENTLKSRFLKEKSFLQHVVHMFAENKPAK